MKKGTCFAGLTTTTTVGTMMMLFSSSRAILSSKAWRPLVSEGRCSQTTQRPLLFCRELYGAPSSSRNDRDDNDDKNLLRQALQKAEERALDNFIQNEAPSWMSKHEHMPFQCTACGKCCQTQGDVYMSPEEIQTAAELLQLTPQQFTQQYASHTLGPSTTNPNLDESSTWIKLRENDVSGACIFLDAANGKHCSIYEARPVQCRTYPFWPNIMVAQKLWNDECRRMDDDFENPLPPWTPAGGGCEGMQTIKSTSSSSSFSSSSSVDAAENVDGVPIREAYRQLYEYVLSDKRFPKGAERPLCSNDDSSNKS